MNNLVDKKLMQIPLEYFNQTIDSSYSEYLALKERKRALDLEKEALKEKLTDAMPLSREIAVIKAIEKSEKAVEDKFVILNGFISVTTAMCEERIKRIEYLTKVHLNIIGREDEVAELKEEEYGIFEYLAKVDKIKESLQDKNKAKDEDSVEPESI